MTTRDLTLRIGESFRPRVIHARARAGTPHGGEARASDPHAVEPQAGKPTLRYPTDEGMAARKAEVNVSFVYQVLVDAYQVPINAYQVPINAYEVLIDAYQVLVNGYQVFIKSIRAAPTGGYLGPSLI